MSKQNELQNIADYVDKMIAIRVNNKDKIVAYQHKILELLLREKTTQVQNTELGGQLRETEKENRRLADLNEKV